MATEPTTTLTSHTRRMIESHPEPVSLELGAVLACIQTCLDCAQACVSCADACLAEENMKALVRCIRLDQDCADLCEATAKILSRQTAFDKELAITTLRACESACRICAEECERHADAMEHCNVCADACRTCEQACRNLLEVSTQ